MFTKLLTSLDAAGFEPYSKNIWESLPYSFVVDWFLQVSDLLAELDALWKTVVRYDLDARIDSIKYESIRHVPNPVLGKYGAVLLGGIKSTSYDRSCFDSIGELEEYEAEGNFSVSRAIQSYCLFYTNL